MNPREARERLRAAAVVAVVRAPDADAAVGAAAALAAAGVRAIELTFTTPGAGEALRRVRRELPADVLVGAGTIRERDQLETAVDAGAEFLVTPHLDPGLLAAMVSRGRLALPGVMTPSEVAAALAVGAEVVKLFPASTVGIAHMRALRAPFPGLLVVPTGGIGPAAVRPWLDAGALAVGAGSELCPAPLVAARRWDDLTAAAAEFLAAAGTES
jgi:2-dehydro-3-deoxyphosphogluconate aldolase/(4S)-4-hydroxy-2-oxoglutarate aldolase